VKGFVVAGTRSGVGKTVATLAVIRALQEEGQTVQPAKAGPDFIDPSHHAQVAGRPSRTLDRWMQGVDGMRRNYWRGEGGVCVVEGVMGLYDGDASSTAAVAAALDLPVVLVVNASAGMESVAATALGFERYGAEVNADVQVAGILAQRCHGGRHAEGIRHALPEDLTYFGRIPPDESLEIPERHLGLERGDETPLEADALEAAAAHLDVDRLLDVAREPPTASPRTDRPASDPTVAVAWDDAFSFAYPATMERLREGATVRTFEAATGDDLPACDGVYLPGGYPELFAAELAASPAIDSIARQASEGLPVLGECGGLMALAHSLTTAEGATHEMAGVLPATVRMHDRYQALDHVEIAAREATLTAGSSETLHGHEFHYSTATVDRDARFAFDVVRGEGIDGERDGLTEHRTLGTYCHVHPESGAFDSFLEAVA